jgi:2-hydroxychromene-2-carboxylate isomerase
LKTRHLDFYFDYLSPYAYFAWCKIADFCSNHDVELRIHPVVFGKLLDHWGQLGPAEIPPKREWLVKYCHRYAEQHGIEFKGPQFHPFNPLPALRLTLREVSGTNQENVVSAIFEAGWSQGKDIGDPRKLMSILDSLGVDGAALVEQIQKPSIKKLLKQETDRAIELGVFGVPTMIIDEQLFWGNDQFEHMSIFIEGNDSLDVAKVTEALGSTRAIDRKKVMDHSCPINN